MAGLAPLHAYTLEPSEDGTYLIATSADLTEFRSVVEQNASANARLTADIDMGGAAWEPIIGPGNAFYDGSFDGAGYTVSGYVITDGIAVDNTTCAGFFAGTGPNATIKNLTVGGTISIEKDDDLYVGGVAGCIQGTVTGCVNSGTLTAKTSRYVDGYVGGIAGLVDGGKITNCVNVDAVSLDGTILNNGGVGGIAGQIRDEASVSNCVNQAAITAKGEDAYAGGIVGTIESSNANLENSFNIGAVTAYKSAFGGSKAGGIAGNNVSSFAISNCGYVKNSEGNAEYGVCGAWGPGNGDDNTTQISQEDYEASETPIITTVKFNKGRVDVQSGGEPAQVTITTLPQSTEDLGSILPAATLNINIDEDIASADIALPNINVTGLSAGETTMTVKGKLFVTNFAGGASTESDVELSCLVSVTDAEVLGVSLNTTTLELEPGETANLTYTLNPAYAKPSGAVQWTSSDTNVATVDNGTVTAVSEGTATITLTVDEKTATCTVTVESGVVAVESITLAEETIAIKAGETREAPAYTITPDNATNKEVRWSSGDESVFTVDAQSGQITAVAAGEAILTVTTVSEGKSAQCTVKVSAADESDGETPSEPAPNQGGSGGGCSAGFGALALLAFAPIALRRMKK